MPLLQLGCPMTCQVLVEVLADAAERLSGGLCLGAQAIRLWAAHSLKKASIELIA